MIKVRLNGKVREFDSQEQLEKYLEAQNPKPKKKKGKKKVEYKAVEEEGDNGEA